MLEDDVESGEDSVPEAMDVDMDQNTFKTMFYQQIAVYIKEENF